MEGIRDLLRAEGSGGWVAYLDGLDDCELEVRLPPAGELPSTLLTLAVPHDDIDAVLAARPDRRADPQLWWLLERCTRTLVTTMGSLDPPPRFPPLPARVGRYFYVYVFLAALPYVRAFHASRGVPAEVSRLTLVDLGRNMAVHRWRTGTTGLHAADWLMRHFRGAIYQLGRLQFERVRLGERMGAAVRAGGLPYGPGDPVLAVHVPAFYGPLRPQACDLSFEWARRFFAEAFPSERYGVAVCHSWLLDDQLPRYLPPGANIVAFQRRFRPAYRRDDDDRTILGFVFGRDAPSLESGPLESRPRRSRLERAILDHLQAGGHWRGGAGWMPLERVF